MAAGRPALTYAEVGATLAPSLPEGYGHVDVRRRVGPPEDLERLGAVINGWGLQRGAGLEVPDRPVELDADVRLRLGPLPVPVRIVAVLDEPDRRGFVYGTLPGHPERGEEAFLAERDAEGTWLHVRAFSVPATLLSRLGGPLTGVVQRHYTERYLRAGARALRSAEPG